MKRSLGGRMLDALEAAPVLGKPFVKLQQRLWQRHVWRLRTEAGRLAHRQTEGRVAKGLFAGMLVDAETSWGKDQYTVINGQYEEELQPILTDAVRRRYACYIDIGCANGFYAVGLALAAPDARIIAFDIDPAARETTARNAAINGVADRIDIRAEADWAILDAELSREPDTFVICDIEGAELMLLDPAACPALRKADFIVEVHGDVDAVIAALSSRFEATHETRAIDRAAKNPFKDELFALPSEDHAWALVSEGRTFTRYNWLLMTRRPA